MDELRAELRAVQTRNAQLERRISRLEDQQAVLTARTRHDAEPAEQPWDGDRVPQLTVVKLKPRHARAPPIDTGTEVQEPDPQRMASLLSDVDPPGGSSDPAPSDAETAAQEQAFQAGVEMLKTGNIAGGVLKLQTFAAEHPRSARADNALLFSGVGLLATDDVDGAAVSFEKVLSDYPAGDARMEALLRLGDCRLRQNQKKIARDLYARVISTYPGTSAADQARHRLAQLTQ